jgi:uncharacterized protein
MPEGKPAGVRCVQLTADDRCLLFGRTERPTFCVSLRPSEEMCGRTREEAYAGLVQLERLTAPAGPGPSAVRAEPEISSANLPHRAD